MEHLDTPALARSLARLRIGVGVLAALVAVLTAAVAWLALRAPDHAVIEEIRARRIVVLDDRNVVRLELGQDAADAVRRARSAGVLLFDRNGVEQGGMVTFDDGSVAITLDAPSGIGEESQRDRAGLSVQPDGSSQMLLRDNLTRGVVRLRAEADGSGGLDTFQWDHAGGTLRTRTRGFGDDVLDARPLQRSP